jgi:phage terminase large subunit-like protein
MSGRPTKKASDSPSYPPFDPVTDYARQVISGVIPSNKWVRLACQRHLSDLSRTDLYWDLPAALHRIDFCPKFLRLLFKEEPYKRPFHLLPFQAFIEGCKFGWKKRGDPNTPITYLSDGRSTLYRRFWYTYTETAKGGGKSPLGASTSLYMATADGEPQAECYFAAGKRDQAMIAFLAAVAMRDISPAIEKRLAKSGIKTVWQMTYLYPQSEREERLKGSFLKPIASDDTQSGYRPHHVLFDEIHEIDRPTVVEMMRKALGKNRSQPMIDEWTNSGADRNSICYQHRQQAEKALDGTLPNDALFAFIAGLDDGDLHSDRDPMEYLLEHEELWVKANPGITHGLPSYEYVRQQIRDAIGLPSQRNLVLRLHFCQWTDALTVYIPDEMWMWCADTSSAAIITHPKHGQISRLEEELLGKRCYGGIDLARSNDWSALMLVFPTDAGDPTEEVCSILEWYWIDEETFKERVRKDRMMEVWEREGHLIVTPGPNFNPGVVRTTMLEKIIPRYVIEGIAYDRTFAHQLVTTLEQTDNITMVEWAQTFMMMGTPVAEILRRARGRLWRHRGHPVTRWMMKNVQVVTDPAGLQMMDKKRSVEKIDGPVALADATGWMMRKNTGQREPRVFVFEDTFF